MDRWNTYRTTMQYALTLVEGEMALAARLDVKIGTIRNWLDGITPIPDRIFLRTVDIIVEASKDDIARMRTKLANGPKLK